MTQDEIIHMAREAWGDGKTYNFYSPKHWPEVEEMFVRFATLVAAAEREAIKWNSIHSCHADCQNPACVIVREAVAAEREACAKVAEERLLDKANCTAEQMYEIMKKSIAEAIRARGQQ